MRIALTKLIKGRPAAAGVYLNVLRDDLTYGSWAEGHLERLRGNRSLDEPEILRVRSRMVTEDDVHLTQVRLPNGEWSVSAEKTLESLLARNPRNRMAFEYLMAHYLMELDLKRAVQRLRSLDNFNYPHIPRSYEEALLLYQQVAGIPPELQRHSIRPHR